MDVIFVAKRLGISSWRQILTRLSRKRATPLYLCEGTFVEHYRVLPTEEDLAR